MDKSVKKLVMSPLKVSKDINKNKKMREKMINQNLNCLIKIGIGASDQA